MGRARNGMGTKWPLARNGTERHVMADGRVALGKVAPRKLNPSTVCALEI